MTGIADITTESIKSQLGLDVPEIYVIIAKHSVMGMDSDSLRDILGCDTQDVLDVEATNEYKAVRQLIAGRYAEMLASQSASWDQIENIAVTNLVKRLPVEKDSDFLLRVAAVANKAQRRHQKETGVLEPGTRAGRTVITLTQRLTQRLTRGGNETVEETRQLSIRDGSMSNPSFDEIDSLLTVSGKPVLSRDIEVKTRVAEPSLEELDEAMKHLQ